MEEEKKESRQKREGGESDIRDLLHNKEQKLPSLRTYKGDVSDFIKEKNQSVASITVKERESKREKGELKTSKTKETHKLLSLNMLILSIVLLVAGGLASIYIFRSVGQDPTPHLPDEKETKIIPYNHTLDLVNVDKNTLGLELAKLSLENGISVMKISDQNSSLLERSFDFFNFLEISLPSTLRRTLGEDFAVGGVTKDNSSAYFIVIKISDFGLAFSGMLEWEMTMERDLAFLNSESESQALTTETDFVATSTQEVMPPLAKNIWQWQDLIIKNKDTRGLVNQYEESKLAYTFLDKNTILIINKATAVAEMSAAYASRSFAR